MLPARESVMKYLTIALCVSMWAGCSRNNSQQKGTTTSSGGGKTFDPCSSDPKSGYDPASKGLTACCDVGPAHCVPSSDVNDRLAANLTACPDGMSVCIPD